MKESEALVMLQDVDLKLMRERHALKQMPQVPKIEAVRAAKKKLASDYKKILGQLKDCQMDIEDNESDHVRMEDITKDVHEQIEDGRASYRTTRDLDLQLSALAKRIEKLEFTHKELERNLAKLQQAQKNALDLDHKLTQHEQALEEGELLHLSAATLPELLQLSREGLLTDAKTLTCLLWLQLVHNGSWTLDWQGVGE